MMGMATPVACWHAEKFLVTLLAIFVACFLSLPFPLMFPDGFPLRFDPLKGLPWSMGL